VPTLRPQGTSGHVGDGWFLAKSICIKPHQHLIGAQGLVRVEQDFQRSQAPRRQAQFSVARKPIALQTWRMRCNGHGNARRRGRFWTDRRMPSMAYCYIITSIEWCNYDRSTSLQQMKHRYAPDFTPPRPDDADDADDRVGRCAKGCHRYCTAPKPRGAGDVGGGVPDGLISSASSPHDFQFTLYKQRPFKTPIW
jgi:hypothetical protein